MKKRVRDLETGEAVCVTEENGVLRFQTTAAHEYALESESAPLESFPVITD